MKPNDFKTQLNSTRKHYVVDHFGVVQNVLVCIKWQDHSQIVNGSS